MFRNKLLSIPASFGITKENATDRTFHGRGFPGATSVRKESIWLDIWSLAVDVLELRAWRDMDPVACILLAAFTAVIAQPLGFGRLGDCVLGFMRLVK